MSTLMDDLELYDRIVDDGNNELRSVARLLRMEVRRLRCEIEKLTQITLGHISEKLNLIDANAAQQRTLMKLRARIAHLNEPNFIPSDMGRTYLRGRRHRRGARHCECGQCKTRFDPFNDGMHRYTYVDKDRYETFSGRTETRIAMIRDLGALP